MLNKKIKKRRKKRKAAMSFEDNHLHSSVKKGHSVQQGLPHGQVARFQLVLWDSCKCSFQASTYSLWRIVGKLYRRLNGQRGEGYLCTIVVVCKLPVGHNATFTLCYLQECNGELIVWFCGDPHSESLMHVLGYCDRFKQLIHEL